MLFSDHYACQISRFIRVQFQIVARFSSEIMFKKEFSVNERVRSLPTMRFERIKCGLNALR